MTALKTREIPELKDRDIAILRGFFESRLMTARHVAEIFFQGKGEAAKKSLQQLKSANLIGERPRKVNEPAILHLTRAGLEELKQRGILADYPSLSLAALMRRSQVSDLTIRHELAVMDVKAAFCRSLRGVVKHSLVEFTTWPLLVQFKARRSKDGMTGILVKPDGFIRIRDYRLGNGLPDDAFFLELDRSTEILDTLIARAGCYVSYYRSGGFAEKNGIPRGRFTERPFRVLMILMNEERRNNVAERLLRERQPILTQVCLTTLAEVLADPVGAIWVRPVDYRNAVRGTPFDANSHQSQWGYPHPRHPSVPLRTAHAVLRSTFGIRRSRVGVRHRLGLRLNLATIPVYDLTGYPHPRRRSVFWLARRNPERSPKPSLPSGAHAPGTASRLERTGAHGSEGWAHA